MTSKSQLRERLREGLKKQTSSVKVESDTALNRSVLSLLSNLQVAKNPAQAPPSTVWAGFQAMSTEPDLRSAMQEASDKLSIEWAFPRVEGQDLKFYVPQKAHGVAAFAANKWGILEPIPSHSRPVGEADLVGLLVPGLGFDLRCNRIGRGAGYYDRALARWPSAVANSNENKRHNMNSPEGVVKIGVAFDWQISEEEIPVESFDVPMDWVVTESRTIRRSPLAVMSSASAMAEQTGRKTS